MDKSDILCLEDLFHELCRYISLRDMLTIRLLCKQTYKNVKKEFNGYWVVESLRIFFAKMLPEVSYDELLTTVISEGAVLSGSFFYRWALNDISPDWTLRFNSVTKGKRSVLFANVKCKSQAILSTPNVFEKLHLYSEVIGSGTEKLDLFVFGTEFVPNGKSRQINLERLLTSFKGLKNTKPGDKLYISKKAAVVGPSIIHSDSTIQFMNRSGREEVIFFNGKSVWFSEFKTFNISYPRKRKSRK